MADISRRAKNAKKSLYQKGYKYLFDNFHKFSQREKIRIALDVYKMEHTKPLVDSTINNNFEVKVVIDDGDKAPQESGNRISEYLKV